MCAFHPWGEFLFTPAEFYVLIGYMPSRAVPFVNGEYYHVFNRGVAKMPIFNSVFDYKHFISTLLYYRVEGPKPRFSFFRKKPINLENNEKIVSIICYCLMPNHFHFLLRQEKENGITEFISKVSNSYTKYFNIKNERIGPLFQGEFKSVHVDSNEQLLHLSRYIHLNPLIGYVTKELHSYRWSSYTEYLGLARGICSKDEVFEQFKSVKDYERFILDQVDYARALEFIKHNLLDGEE